MKKMQNIEAILKEYGLEIPEDKKEEFRVKFHENYKTINDYDTAVIDRDNWKSRAEAAEETLKGFDGVDLDTMKNELADWKKKAEEAEAEYNKKIYDRDFSDTLKAEMEAYKFSSEAAKKSVMAEIKEAGLKLKDGKILGLSDLINQIKENDASAFVSEAEQNKARFTTTVKQHDVGGRTFTDKKEVMAIKDPSERQAAIAENLSLFGR